MDGNPSKKGLAQFVVGESLDNEHALSVFRVFIVQGDKSGVVNFSEFNEAWLTDPEVRVLEQSLAAEQKSMGGYVIKQSYYGRPFENQFAPCGFVPTQFVPLDELASIWDHIVYTEHENIVSAALKIILPDYENLVFIANERSGASASPQRIAKVKLAGQPRPVPLKSLGEGMVRILQIAIKLVSAQGGFLLIDEFENGLHYSVQKTVFVSCMFLSH